MAYGNNYGRWDNFSNSKLYEKYKHSQQPVMSAPSQQQQQPMDNSWNDLGNNIGKAWRESLARRNDGEYAGQKMSRVGLDKSISDEQLANMPKGFQNGYNAEQGVTQMVSHPETTLGTFGDGTGASYADTIAKEFGKDALTDAGKGALTTIGESAGAQAANIGTNIAGQAVADSVLMGGGGAAAGEAIGAGTAAATEAGASAGASAAGLGSVLGPLGIAAGIYGLGTMFDWW